MTTLETILLVAAGVTAGAIYEHRKKAKAAAAVDPSQTLGPGPGGPNGPAPTTQNVYVTVPDDYGLGPTWTYGPPVYYGGRRGGGHHGGHHK